MTFHEALTAVGRITDWSSVWETLRKGGVPHPLNAERWTDAEYAILEHALVQAKLRHNRTMTRP